jgi:hypothetical protein
LLGVWTLLTALLSGVLLLWVEYRSGLFVKPEPPPATEDAHAAQEVTRLRAVLEEARHQATQAEIDRGRAREEAAQAAREAAALRRQLREAAAASQAELARLRARQERELAQARKEANQPRQEATQGAEERQPAVDPLVREAAGVRRQLETAPRARQEAAQAAKEKAEAPAADGLKNENRIGQSAEVLRLAASMAGPIDTYRALISQDAGSPEEARRVCAAKRAALQSLFDAMQESPAAGECREAVRTLFDAAARHQDVGSADMQTRIQACRHLVCLVKRRRLKADLVVAELVEEGHRCVAAYVRGPHPSRELERLLRRAGLSGSFLPLPARPRTVRRV